MNRKIIPTFIAVACLMLAPLFDQQAKAQGGGQHPGNSAPRVPDLRRMDIINGASIVADISSDVNRLTCARIDGKWRNAQTLRFSIGFPEIEALGRRGRAQGSWTIRTILFTTPEQVTGYDLDGKFNDSGQTLLNGAFTLTGTANYLSNFCAESTPPPVTPSPATPVNVTIQGTCGVRNRAGVTQPTDITFEASDAAGVILRGSFKARVICGTSQDFSSVNNNLDRH